MDCRGGAVVTSTPTSFSITVPETETAVLNISNGHYTVTDSAGVTGTGGTISGNTFTANNLASGQAAFSIAPFSTDDRAQMTVAFGAANVIPATTTVTIGAGTTLDLNGFSDAIDPVNDDRGGSNVGTITNSKTGTTATLTIGSNNGSGSFNGTISNGAGTVALVKTGTGTETLTGTNTYSGGTTIDSGTLNINSDSALGADKGTLTFNGGTLQFGGGSGVTLGVIRKISVDTSGNVTFDTDGNGGIDRIEGVISSTANGNLIKIGSGTLEFDNTNTYTGSTIVDAGTLNVSSTGSLGSGALIVNNTNPSGPPTQTLLSLYTLSIGRLAVGHDYRPGRRQHGWHLLEPRHNVCAR